MLLFKRSALTGEPRAEKSDKFKYLQVLMQIEM